MNTKEIKIYGIPGLGLNAQIFEHLQFKDCDLKIIEWIEPLKKESLSNYAKRISQQLEEGEVVLIGHSFGGVLAQEIAQHLRVNHIFLISSIKSPKQLPFSFKLLSMFSLYKLVSRQSILITFPLWAHINGYVSKNLRSIFRDSMKTHSSYYLQWSLKEISNWQGTVQKMPPITQIHGNADLTFPLKKITEPLHVIKGGNHLMVHSLAEEIKTIISAELDILSS